MTLERLRRALLPALVLLLAGTRECLSIRGSDVDFRFPVWVWWDYRGERPDGIVQATLATWEKHVPASLFEIRYVNTSNVARWLPDLPEEAMRLPYGAAYSDLVRAGLLAEHGGVYLDTDMLLARDLQDLLGSLEDGSADIVTYENTFQSCQDGRFSSNFLAGVKGNALSKAWYAEIVRQLKTRCPLDKKKDLDPRQRVCCYEPWGSPRECHVPWGGIGERIGHAALKEVLARKQELGFNGVFCFREKAADGFAPCGTQCLWADKAAPQDAGKRMVLRLYERSAYHLFASSAPKTSYEELLQGNWVVSELVRRALGPGEAAPRP